MGASLWKTYVGSNSKFLWSVFKKGPESVGNIGNNNQGRRKFDYGRVLASLRLDVRECWRRVCALLITPGSVFIAADFLGRPRCRMSACLLRASLQLRILCLGLLRQGDFGSLL